MPVSRGLIYGLIEVADLWFGMKNVMFCCDLFCCTSVVLSPLIQSFSIRKLCLSRLRCLWAHLSNQTSFVQFLLYSLVHSKCCTADWLCLIMCEQHKYGKSMNIQASGVCGWLSVCVGRCMNYRSGSLHSVLTCRPLCTLISVHLSGAWH